MSEVSGKIASMESQQVVVVADRKQFERTTATPRKGVSLRVRLFVAGAYLLLGGAIIATVMLSN